MENNLLIYILLLPLGHIPNKFLTDYLYYVNLFSKYLFYSNLFLFLFLYIVEKFSSLNFLLLILYDMPMFIVLFWF